MNNAILIELPLVILVVIAAATDLRRGKVYNWTTYPAAGLGLLLNAVLQPAGLGIGAAALGLLIGFVPLFLGYAGGFLGGGDVKLMGAVGAFLGPWATLYALLYSCLAGAFLSLMWIVYREGPRGMLFRLTHLRLNEEGSARPALRFPFALAVLIGVAWVLVERHLGHSLLDGLRTLRG